MKYHEGDFLVCDDGGFITVFEVLGYSEFSHHSKTECYKVKTHYNEMFMEEIGMVFQDFSVNNEETTRVVGAEEAKRIIIKRTLRR